MRLNSVRPRQSRMGPSATAIPLCLLAHPVTRRRLRLGLVPPPGGGRSGHSGGKVRNGIIKPGQTTSGGRPRKQGAVNAAEAAPLRIRWRCAILSLYGNSCSRLSPIPARIALGLRTRPCAPTCTTNTRLRERTVPSRRAPRKGKWRERGGENKVSGVGEGYTAASVRHRACPSGYKEVPL